VSVVYPNANVVYPKDYSSPSIQQVLDSAESDVIFVGDPRAGIEPGVRMFDRMAQIIRDGAGWVYADAVGHSRIGRHGRHVEMGRPVRSAAPDFGEARDR